jgi:hypothetical protein
VRLFLLGVLVAGAAFSAPDEMSLGKAEGYPVCPPSMQAETRCLIGPMSRRDEVWPARQVQKGANARSLKRAPAEPAFPYTYQGSTGGLDEYLSRNRTTGLLILRGDTILAGRYQYERTPQQRMTSMSMAKTIVAMLVGVALSEGKIELNTDS